MKVNEKLSILFLLEKTKKDKDNKCPITIRITIDGKRAEISLGKKLAAADWDQQKGCGVGTAREVFALNDSIDKARVKLRKLYDLVEDREGQVSPQVLKAEYLGRKLETAPKGKTVLYAVDYVIFKFKEKVDRGLRSAETLKKWDTTKEKIIAFLIHQFNKKDILLTDVQYAFAEDFSDYLVITDGLESNTAMKYLKNTKQVFKTAVKRGWLTVNPIQEFQCTYIEPKRHTLTMEEIIIMYNKPLIQRLEEVRDVYLFSCFTGYAYQDLLHLEPRDIIKGKDGGNWISKDRIKTDNEEMVPLLPIAQEIINKYKNHPYCKATAKLLPVNSNARYNGYLKEIAAICNINKLLTTHTARHTFATTVTLENDVPLETVSKMLGHKSVRTTQIYAKITQKKISNNMNKLKEQLFDSSGILKTVSVEKTTKPKKGKAA